MKRLIHKLKQAGRFELTLCLLVMSLYCLGLSLFRCAVTDTLVQFLSYGLWHGKKPMFILMNKNLFLAAIPWVLTTYVVLNDRLKGKRYVLWAVLLVWLLFFPNAPYILTDLIHLTRHDGAAPAWLDLLIFLSFAWVGLAFGLVSLHDFEDLLHRVFKPWQVRISITSLLFLSSFGVYLGRFERWNSWDIIETPILLMRDIADRFVDPLSHPRTWGMTIFLGVLLNFIYWTIRLIALHQTPLRRKE